MCFTAAEQIKETLRHYAPEMEQMLKSESEGQHTPKQYTTGKSDGTP